MMINIQMDDTLLSSGTAHFVSFFKTTNCFYQIRLYLRNYVQIVQIMYTELQFPSEVMFTPHRWLYLDVLTVAPGETAALGGASDPPVFLQ